MSYIYDIVLNFNKVYYEFYEWKESDKILNFKKIPLLRINNNDYLTLKNDEVIVSKDFIEEIKNNSHLFTNDKNLICCLVSNDREVMGIRFNDEGYISGRSSLIFDESEEVLEEVDDLMVSSIDYSVKKENNFKKIVSRCVNEKREYLLDFFNSNNNINIYRYLYYDFYEKEEADIDKIKSVLMKVLEDTWSGDCEKLYQNIKLLVGVR